MVAYATKACRISEGARAIGISLKRSQMKDGDAVDWEYILIFLTSFLCSLLRYLGEWGKKRREMLIFKYT